MAVKQGTSDLPIYFSFRNSHSSFKENIRIEPFPKIDELSDQILISYDSNISDMFFPKDDDQIGIQTEDNFAFVKKLNQIINNNNSEILLLALGESNLFKWLGIEQEINQKYKVDKEFKYFPEKTDLPNLVIKMDIPVEEVGNIWDSIYTLIEIIIDAKNSEVGEELFKKSYFLDFDIITIKNQIWD